MTPQAEWSGGRSTVPARQAHTPSLSIMSLIFSIARDGARPFGQTSVQFMMVRQRNSRYASSRSSSRSGVARSRPPDFPGAALQHAIQVFTVINSKLMLEVAQFAVCTCVIA